MEFKVNLALFKATEEGNKKFYGDKYDPSKPYPQYTGNIQLTEMDIIKMVEYLQKATPERTDFPRLLPLCWKRGHHQPTGEIFVLEKLVYFRS